MINLQVYAPGGVLGGEDAAEDGGLSNMCLLGNSG